MSLFLKIVEKGSLIAVSQDVGLSPTTVSERLASLEAHFDVVHLNRTTRAISLTDEGHIRFGAQTLSLPIRMSAPVDLRQARRTPPKLCTATVAIADTVPTKQIPAATHTGLCGSTC